GRTFSAGGGSRGPTGGEIPGTAVGHEHGPPGKTPRQPREGAGTLGRGPRVVHRGVSNARLAGGRPVARQLGWVIVGACHDRVCYGNFAEIIQPACWINSKFGKRRAWAWRRRGGCCSSARATSTAARPLSDC